MSILNFNKMGYTHFSVMPRLVRDWNTRYETYVFIWLRWYSIKDDNKRGYKMLHDNYDDKSTSKFNFIVN